jgi:hypothetical protein
MSFSAQEIERINKAATAWGRKVRAQLKISAKGSISTQLRMQNRYDYGLISKIGYRFPRHGVFVEMGVFGGLSREEAIAQGKLRPMPWFNPVLDDKLDELGEELGQITSELALGVTKSALTWKQGNVTGGVNIKKGD